MTAPDWPMLRNQLRTLMTDAAYKAYVALYSEGQQEEQDVVAPVLALTNGVLQLAAATMLEGLVSLTGGASKIKLGPLELALKPEEYRAQAAALRAQVKAERSGPRPVPSPLAGMRVGRSDAPQAFRVGDPPACLSERES